MQTRISILSSFLTIIILGGSLHAQDLEIRPEDHFYRRKVVNRIDLNEKVNQPLIQRQSAIYGDNQKIQKQGLVGALMMGLEEGRFVAYHPDDITQPLSYEEVLQRVQDMDLSGSVEADWETDDLSGSDDFISEDMEEGDHFWDEPFGPAEESIELDLAAFESVIQFVEDRIFDKNRGQMVYQ
ncbi:MAG: hypothetical protein AAGM67_05775, partial [Bacteroidota bacterium]